MFNITTVVTDLHLLLYKHFGMEHLKFKHSGWMCLKTVIKLAWHIPVPNVWWRTPEDGQRNCPKHVEFLDKNKFGKINASLGFIIKKNVLCYLYIRCAYVDFVNEKNDIVSYVYRAWFNKLGLLGRCLWGASLKFCIEIDIPCTRKLFHINPTFIWIIIYHVESKGTSCAHFFTLMNYMW